MPSPPASFDPALRTPHLLVALLIPGSALLAVNKNKQAFAIPLLGFLWVAMISWSRWVISPTGFIFMLVGLAALHAISYIAAIKTGRQQGWPNTTIKTYCMFIALALFNISIALACHLYKDRWLGFAFYHIPSPSMAPTLQNGDVVMIDTWAYTQQSAQPNDIIIVKRTAASMVLAKRMQKTRNKAGKTELFIVGDNPSQSIDSRSFGWVADDYLIGQVRFVWFSFKDLNRYLKTVN